MFEPLKSFLERVEKEPEPTWLIPDLLPDRGKVFIVAEPSAGKTWLALIACRSAASDGRDVFIVEEEGSGRSLGWRMKALGMQGSVYVAHATAALIDDARCRAALVARISGAKRPVIVFDPFTSLHSGNENDTEHANMVRRYLTEVANAHPESLVIVCHHTSKNTERSDMYAGRGSSVFAAWVDVQLNLKHVVTRKEENRVSFNVLLAKSRDGHRGLKRDLSIDLETGAVESSDPAEETDDDLDALIVGALKEAPGGLTRDGLLKVVRRKKAVVLARVKELVRLGRATETKSGRATVLQLAVAEQEAA